MSRLGTETAFAVSAEANEWRALGHTVYPFHLGDMDLPTPENIVEAAFRAIRDGKTGYCPNAGIPELREALAADVGASHGIDYGPQNVAVQPGGKPVIEKFLLTLMDPGDEVLYPSPGFPIYESQIEFLGGVAKPYGFVPGREELPARLRGHRGRHHARAPGSSSSTTCTTPPAPRAPTRRSSALAELALRHDLVRALATRPTGTCATPARSRSIASLPGMAERTVILYTFSKKYAMTGWRLGGAIGPEDLIARHRHAERQRGVVHRRTSSSGPASRRSPATSRARRRSCASSRSAATPAVDLLNEIPGVSCYRPEATFYLFPDVTGLMERKGLDDLRRAAARGAGADGRQLLHPPALRPRAARRGASATCASPTPASAPSSSARGSAGSRSGRR